MSRRIVPLVTAILMAGATPRAQSQTPAAANAPAPEVVVTLAYELHHDHYYYQFDNTSSIDTSFSVPHSFRQTYADDAQWVAATVRYPFFGDHMVTEFAAAPTIGTAGKDFDTFFDPGGDVVVSGTAGDVNLGSWRIAQWAEGSGWGLVWRLGYKYRRDAADFLPADVILTHSNPPAEIRRPTADREHTRSEVHQVPVEASRPLRISPRWTLVAGASAAPITRARLTTILPDKYPGREIVFEAHVVEAEGRLQLLRQSARWPVAFAVQYGRTWSYRAAAQFRRDALQASVRLGIAP